MVLGLHRQLVAARNALTRCIGEMTQLPGTGGMAGIIARSVVNSTDELLTQLQENPFIVFPSPESYIEEPPDNPGA